MSKDGSVSGNIDTGNDEKQHGIDLPLLSVESYLELVLWKIIYHT